jgi:hypothetical protein
MTSGHSAGHGPLVELRHKFVEIYDGLNGTALPRSDEYENQRQPGDGQVDNHVRKRQHEIGREVQSIVRAVHSVTRIN